MLSDHMLRQMVDALPMPVFVQDEVGHYVYANRAFETLFQVRADSLTQGVELVAIVPASLRHRTETTTFCTPNGEQLTMSMIHTQSIAQTITPELDAVNAELRKARTELVRMRETDPVTQALSRRALRAHTDDSFGSTPAGVLRISIDDLASITAQFGHEIGDDLLTRFSDIIRSNTRPGDVFARIDESEFAVVLHEADRDQTAAVAQRICRAFNDARTLDGQPQLALSITVGAAFSDATDTQLSAVIEEAERALRSGTPCRNEVVVA